MVYIDYKKTFDSLIPPQVDKRNACIRPNIQNFATEAVKKQKNNFDDN